MPAPLAIPLLAGGAKFLGKTALWYGAGELLNHFISSETGQQEARRQTKQITEAIQDPEIPEEEKSILGSALSSIEEAFGPEMFGALGLATVVAPARKFMAPEKGPSTVSGLPAIGQTKAVTKPGDVPLTGPVMGGKKAEVGPRARRPFTPVGAAASPKSASPKALTGTIKKLLPQVAKRPGIGGLITGLLALAVPTLFNAYENTFGEPPPEEPDEAPTTPEEPSAPEEPQPGLQVPMPGQEEEPEGPQDTRTPRQKRKFISTPGRPRGVKRMNPFYVPPPGGEEADPEAAQRPGLPMTPVPEGQPEAIPGMMPEEPQIDQAMPELAKARRDKTDVVTDQRIGDPSGLDFVRPKPAAPEQRPELPMTGVPGEQPEAIPDMTPTDQDIEGLFNGQGMPERFQDDPSKDAVSAAFLRERGKAFGDARGQIEGAPGLYEEPEGVDFIDTPEGQALLQNRMTPMSPEGQAPPGGIDPLTPRARMPASPTPEIPGMTPRVPPGRPGPIRPELETTISPDQPEAIPDAEGIDLDRLMPELQRSGQTPRPQVKEDILDILATMQPQDPGPPTDDDIVSLFEGGNVPPSQMSQEEIKNMLIEVQTKLEEQPNLPLTEEDERKFAELLSLLKR